MLMFCLTNTEIHKKRNGQADNRHGHFLSRVENHAVGAKQVGELYSRWIYQFSDQLRPGHNHRARPLRD